MSIQHLNDVKTIARSATTFGVTLPGKVSSALKHLDEIITATPPVPAPGLMAREIGAHVGHPAKMKQALDAAALELATAEARRKLYNYLPEVCGSRVRSIMSAHRDEIVGAFGNALSSDLATLNASAGLLPTWFREDTAADLDAATFEVWTRTRDAYQRVTAAQAALTPLYAGAIGQESAIHFPPIAAASLRFAEPPKFNASREAYAFRDALAGRTERVQGTAGQGSTFVDGLFIPTALADRGASFKWATPADVTARAEAIVAGMARQAAPA